MEEDIYYAGALGPVEKVLSARLGKAIDTAQERHDYEAAHNQELLKALAIVKAFLKKRGRVCYGGTAMNMILPVKKRFYNSDTDLPDYDFFTPSIDEDIKALVSDLKKAGFRDVLHRVGMHEGTKKILVNFSPIADMSAISPEVYSVFHKRAIIKGGIRYTDPDILRMMMYLEMSRPKGEVSRWQKVYERLRLINLSFPPKVPRNTRKAMKPRRKLPLYHEIVSYTIERQRILMLGGLSEFYKRVFAKKTTDYDTMSGGDGGILGILSPFPRADAREFKLLFGEKEITLLLHKPRGEIVPEYVEVKFRGQSILLIFQEVACNSYLNFQTTDGRTIAIASPDTLITMYYSIFIFTKSAKIQIPGLGRQIADLVKGVEANRSAAAPAIPAFSLNCRGYQKEYSTLLREKIARIEEEKKKLES
jgi:hypothetical protein